MQFIDIGKKELELDSLHMFIGRYQEVTGVQLELLSAMSEAPDFICVDQNGNRVDVEVTQVTMSPEDRTWAMINGREGISPSDVSAQAWSILWKKSPAYHRRIYKTIVVVDVHDAYLSSLHEPLQFFEPSDYEDLNFDEIWLSDRSEEEAFADVELYCLHPPDLRGYYPREPCKPYG